MAEARIECRQAALEDISVLVDLMAEFYAESGYGLERLAGVAAFAALLRDPARGCAWLMCCEGAPAGYLVLSVRHAMEHAGLEGYVDDLFVRPGFRRRGVARTGLDALLAECARRGIVALAVEVGPGNAAAKALYREIGLAPREDERETLVMRVSGT